MTKRQTLYTFSFSSVAVLEIKPRPCAGHASALPSPTPDSLNWDCRYITVNVSKLIGLHIGKGASSAADVSQFVWESSVVWVRRVGSMSSVPSTHQASDMPVAQSSGGGAMRI